MERRQTHPNPEWVRTEPNETRTEPALLTGPKTWWRHILTPYKWTGGLLTASHTRINPYEDVEKISQDRTEFFNDFIALSLKKRHVVVICHQEGRTLLVGGSGAVVQLNPSLTSQLIIGRKDEAPGMKAYGNTRKLSAKISTSEETGQVKSIDINVGKQQLSYDFNPDGSESPTIYVISERRFDTFNATMLLGDYFRRSKLVLKKHSPFISTLHDKRAPKKTHPKPYIQVA